MRVSRLWNGYRHCGYNSCLYSPNIAAPKYLTRLIQHQRQQPDRLIYRTALELCPPALNRIRQLPGDHKHSVDGEEAENSEHEEAVCNQLQ